MRRAVVTAALLVLAVAPAARADDEGAGRIRELIEEHLAEGSSPGGRDRLADVDTAEDARVALAMKKRLDTQRVSINFDDTPMADALDFYRDITGINIVLSKQARDLIADEDLRVKLRLKDILLRNAFELTLGVAGDKLVYGVRHGVLTIALKEEFEARVRLKLYFIDDLIREPEDYPAPKLDLGGLVNPDD